MGAPTPPPKDVSVRSKSSASSPSPHSSSSPPSPSSQPPRTWSSTMVYLPAGLLALSAALLVHTTLRPDPHGVKAWSEADLPSQAQIIRRSSFAVLDNVPPPSQANISTQFVPPGLTLEALAARPFHIYDEEFWAIIGSNPTLTLIAETQSDPIFHEAVTWYPPTDEVFFVQNAGAVAAGTGLAKSAIIQKISLAEAAQAAGMNVFNATGIVEVVTVDADPPIINPNGATNYKDGLLFMGEGQGETVPSAMYFLNPVEPYDTKVLINNYYGRQFNSLNDVAINPRNKDIYFTDVTYGYLQDFRPAPGLPNQIYRFNEQTGAVQVVSDSENKPNGLTFSPDGTYAYVADTGAFEGFRGVDQTLPATIYRYTVNDDGTFGNRQTFAFISPGGADGMHCDAAGNVYAGCGDGVQVFNPSGKLIGKIFLGTTSSNFQIAGHGRMVICAETKLFYATLSATAAPITDYNYS